MTAPVRHEWYQTDSDVVIEIFKRHVNADICQVDFQPDRVKVQVKNADSDLECIFERTLFLPVDVEKCKVIYKQPKIELKLRKKVGGQWLSLEQQSSQIKVPKSAEKIEKPAESVVKTYPSSSSHGAKNWDKIEKEVVEEEKKEELSGDAAVNRLFQQIYADADEDTRKAMVKSFTESKGTVLSTNWGEVKQQEVEAKPPDCMEWKKYD